MAIKKTRKTSAGRKLLLARFGKNVRGRREELDLSQRTLANRVGCTRVNVSHIETGRQGVNLMMLMALCQALECTPDAILT